MRLGLINSAWAQSGRDTAWGIARTREIGFDCIDIFADPLDLTPRERHLIRQTCDEQRLPIVSVCCVAVGLIDFNPSVQRFHVQRCREYLKLVKEYSGENLLLVLGEYIWNREVIPAAEQWQTGVENCRELAEFAEELGIKIALEMEPFPLSLLNTVDAMVKFIEDVNHPALGANLDISHLVLANQSPEDVRKLHGNVFHVHISDCDGKKHGDLPPGRGVVDFLPYLKELHSLNFSGTISIELEYSPEPDKIEEWVREAYLATDRLLQAAGISRDASQP